MASFGQRLQTERIVVIINYQNNYFSPIKFTCGQILEAIFVKHNRIVHSQVTKGRKAAKVTTITRAKQPRKAEVRKE